MKIRLIARKPAINWVKEFMLMVNSSKTEAMSDDDKELINEIVSMIREIAKRNSISDDEIIDLKSIAKTMQTHEALNKFERLKFVSAEIQLSRIRK